MQKPFSRKRKIYFFLLFYFRKKEFKILLHDFDWIVSPQECNRLHGSFLAWGKAGYDSLTRPLPTNGYTWCHCHCAFLCHVLFRKLRFNAPARNVPARKIFGGDVLRSSHPSRFLFTYKLQERRHFRQRVSLHLGSFLKSLLHLFRNGEIDCRSRVLFSHSKLICA